MRIKCIANMATDLPDEKLNPTSDEEYKFAIEIGNEYNVYALTLFQGYIWYYICDEDYVYYPIWNPSPLFVVVDGRISKYWRYNYLRGNSTWPEDTIIFAFKEWSVDPNNYYDKLTDGQEREVALFKGYKDLMDIEFPDPSVEKKASDLGNNWVICPDCDEAWQGSTESGMVRCPKCGVLLHNPLYRNEEA